MRPGFQRLEKFTKSFFRHNLLDSPGLEGVMNSALPFLLMGLETAREAMRHVRVAVEDALQVRERAVLYAAPRIYCARRVGVSVAAKGSGAENWRIW